MLSARASKEWKRYLLDHGIDLRLLGPPERQKFLDKKDGLPDPPQHHPLKPVSQTSKTDFTECRSSSSPRCVHRELFPMGRLKVAAFLHHKISSLPPLQTHLHLDLQSFAFVNAKKLVAFPGFRILCARDSEGGVKG